MRYTKQISGLAFVFVLAFACLALGTPAVSFAQTADDNIERLMPGYEGELARFSKEVSEALANPKVRVLLIQKGVSDLFREEGLHQTLAQEFATRRFQRNQALSTDPLARLMLEYSLQIFRTKANLSNHAVTESIVVVPSTPSLTFDTPHDGDYKPTAVVNNGLVGQGVWLAFLLPAGADFGDEEVNAEVQRLINAGTLNRKNFFKVSAAYKTNITLEELPLPEGMSDQMLNTAAMIKATQPSALPGDTLLPAEFEKDIKKIVEEVLPDLQKGKKINLDKIKETLSTDFGGSLLEETVDSFERRSSQDRDRDGVNDSQEGFDGSNPDDRGSYRVRLRSPVYTLWNGFLDIVNIAEIVNKGDSEMQVTLTLLSQDGLTSSSSSATLPGKSQRDWILNDLPTFAKNSYGLLKIEFSGELDGRLSYYRYSVDREGYDFGFGVPYLNPQFGTSAVTFNTMQPGLSPADSGKLVANWLSIVNLDTQSRSFTVRKYSAIGQEVIAPNSNNIPQTLSIPAGGRVDLDGGHIVPGREYGLIKVVPENDRAPYIAQNMRYGYRSEITSPVQSFSFGFPLSANAGNGQPTYAVLATTSNAQNWVEIANTLDKETSVSVKIYDEAGVLKKELPLILAPNAQQHVDANRYLGADKTGSVSITPARTNSVIAQVMHYFRDPNGSMLSMYGAQTREPFDEQQVSSYNLFLGMFNWMRVVNPSDQEARFTLKVHGLNNKTAERQVTLAPHSMQEFGIHDTQTYQTARDSYGVLSIDSNSRLLAELLRTRKLPNGDNTDFASPSEAR